MDIRLLFSWVLRSRMSGSYGRGMFTQTVFQSACTISHSHQECMRVPALAKGSHFSHSRRSAVVSLRGFNLHFHDEK